MKQKPWEATIQIYPRGIYGWGWGLHLEAPTIRIQSDRNYDAVEYARAAARRAMKRLGLVERVGRKDK